MWLMGYKQPVPDTQVLKVGGSGGMPLGKFCTSESLRLNLQQSGTNYLIPDSRVRIDK